MKQHAIADWRCADSSVHVDLLTATDMVRPVIVPPLVILKEKQNGMARALELRKVRPIVPQGRSWSATLVGANAAPPFETDHLPRQLPSSKKE